MPPPDAARASSAAPPKPARRPRLFASLAGYRAAFLPRDLAAGLTLAAITIPEQMATARLGGFPPELGFFAFIAASLAFAAFGGSRILSAGADSTITPVFAGGLVLFAAAGTPAYAGMAAALALLVGAILICGGLARLGWIADLLSAPMVTGFLAGIAVHIVVSQLPSLLGIAATGDHLFRRVAAIVSGLGGANPYDAAIGIGVFALALAAEKRNPRIPGALIGLAVATLATWIFGLEGRGVAVLGAVPNALPHLVPPDASPERWMHVVPLALIIAIIVMVQTAATARSFVEPDAPPPDVDRDFIGLGAGNLLAGLIGAFPVNASPPRTAITSETGGRSQAAGLFAAALVFVLAGFGGGLLAHVPHAALAAILMYIAVRIFRFREIATIYRRAFVEFVLLVVTLAAIVALPIETGVAVGIVLSLIHGLWSATRPQIIEFVKVPGTSIWWAPHGDISGEVLPGVVVVAFQAPLSFINAEDFRRGVLAAVDSRPETPRLVVLEAGNVIAVDYTAARVFAEVIRACRSRGVAFAVARLESVRAEAALRRFGILDELGPGRLFLSVDEAVRALAMEKPDSAPR